ncbi:RNA-directed DNA polymerase, eukaryota, reverse transcriptase zinc-binding domain protein [Tanacetum coccineum]
MNQQRFNDEVVEKNTDAHIRMPTRHDGFGPYVDHTRVSTIFGNDSQSGTRYTDRHVSLNLDVFPDGDNVRVSTFYGRIASSLNQPHKNVTANITSLGESTNQVLWTMNPSKVQYPKPFKSLWSAGDESFMVTNDVPSPNLVNKELGVNLDSSQVEKPSHESPIVHSVEVNTIPKSYVGSAGADTNDQSNVKSNFCSLVADKVFDGVNISIPCKVVENLIATYLEKPIMLDSYTSLMCKDSWGRSSFTRCLIEINLEADFMESITIGIPELYGPGHTKETIRVEYEWKPPRCPTCNIFRYTGETCPKKVVTTPVENDTNVTNDGFQKVVNRKRNNKGSSVGNKIPKGVSVSKGFQVGKEFAFQPKASNLGSNINTRTHGETSSKSSLAKNLNDDAPLITKGTNVRQQDTGKKKISNIASPNRFAALGVDDDEEEEVENIWDESKNLNLRDTGASTPAQTVVNENNLSVCAILESHVDVATIYDTCKKVNTWDDHKTLFFSFVYADNYYIEHRVLWSNLVGHARLMRNRPWVLLGDFNAVLNLEDHLDGGYEPNAAMREFKECVQDMEVADVNSTGLRFTWNQKLKGSNGILKKIDRIMGNLQFNGNFPGSFAIFQPYRISDHSPCVLCVPTIELDEAQKAFDRDPSSSILCKEHAQYLLAFKEAQLDEERFLKQKSKIE